MVVVTLIYKNLVPSDSLSRQGFKYFVNIFVLKCFRTLRMFKLSVKLLYIYYITRPDYVIV